MSFCATWSLAFALYLTHFSLMFGMRQKPFSCSPSPDKGGKTGRMRSRNCATEDIIELLGLTPAEQTQFLGPRP